jgi:hypothetical protein
VLNKKPSLMDFLIVAAAVLVPFFALAILLAIAK